MMNANDDIISNYGKLSLIVSIVCRLLLLVRTSRFSFVFLRTNNLVFLSRSLLVKIFIFLVDEKIFCCHGGLSPDLRKYPRVQNGSLWTYEIYFSTIAIIWEENLEMRKYYNLLTAERSAEKTHNNVSNALLSCKFKTCIKMNTITK